MLFDLWVVYADASALELSLLWMSRGQCDPSSGSHVRFSCPSTYVEAFQEMAMLAVWVFECISLPYDANDFTFIWMEFQLSGLSHPTNLSISLWNSFISSLSKICHCAISKQVNNEFQAICDITDIEN